MIEFRRPGNVVSFQCCTGSCCGFGESMGIRNMPNVISVNIRIGPPHAPSQWERVRVRQMHKLPRKGTKDLLKLDAMRRPGPPPGANKRELQNTDPCGYK